MFQELEGLQERYRLLLESLTEPAVLANPQRLRELTKEKAELEPLVRAYEDRQRALEELLKVKVIDRTALIGRSRRTTPATKSSTSPPAYAIG